MSVPDQDLIDMLPNDDKFIVGLMENILYDLEGYIDAMPGLETDPVKGTFTIHLSNGKKLVYKPKIVDA